MEYVIKGKITGKNPVKFELKTNAESESHARTLAIVALGAKQGIKKSHIQINEVTKAKQ